MGNKIERYINWYNNVNMHTMPYTSVIIYMYLYQYVNIYSNFIWLINLLQN